MAKGRKQRPKTLAGIYAELGLKKDKKHPGEYIRPADQAPVVPELRSQREGHAKVMRVYAAPLDRLYRRNMITADQYAAGERLRTDHFTAFGTGHHMMNLDGIHGVSAPADNIRFTNHQALCLHAYIEAMLRLTVQEQGFIARSVIFEQGVNEAARQSGFGWRAGMVKLKECLDKLSDHYLRGRGRSGSAGSRRRIPPGSGG